ncbi:MAG: hypothetical protein E6R03_11840 [Hyphomicrobiaceae bacterium]|nr:MAG: hypothetical protein E6R03_11840 [Hyphomicrobiaceae bacterium]
MSSDDRPACSSMEIPLWVKDHSVPLQDHHAVLSHGEDSDLLPDSVRDLIDAIYRLKHALVYLEITLAMIVCSVGEGYYLQLSDCLETVRVAIRRIRERLSDLDRQTEESIGAMSNEPYWRLQVGLLLNRLSELLLPYRLAILRKDRAESGVKALFASMGAPQTEIDGSDYSNRWQDEAEHFCIEVGLCVNPLGKYVSLLRAATRNRGQSEDLASGASTDPGHSRATPCIEVRPQSTEVQSTRTDCFASVREWLRTTRRKGEQVAVLKALVDAGGTMPLAKLIKAVSLDWTGSPIEKLKSYNNLAYRMNKVLEEEGQAVRLRQQGGDAIIRLEETRARRKRNTRSTRGRRKR